jgi:hypothetical protein
MPAVEGRGVFDHRVAVQGGYNTVEQPVASFGVRYFAAPKNNRYFNPVFLLEEFFDVAYLEINIVSFYFRTYFYFFDEAARLRFTGFALSLALLVKVFTEIHYPAYGWFGVRRDFNQVEAFLFGLG